MGKGLPKKYAKMGFKKGWREYKKTKRKTSAKRRSSPKPKPRRSSKRSTRSSNPGGGARTSKIGALFKKIKAAFNLTEGAQGSATLEGLDWEAKLRNGVARHTGVIIQEDGAMAFNINNAIPTWQGMTTEMMVQYFDSKTRHFGNISRHKLLDIAEEALPIFMAHNDASGTVKYATNFARSYHKQTTGYDMHGGGVQGYGDWDLSRVNAYGGVKLVRAIGNASGFIPWVNRHLPKGLNL